MLVVLGEMERIIKTVRREKRRERFPDTGYSSLKRENTDFKGFTSVAVENITDQSDSTPPQNTFDYSKQNEIAEKRRNFAITRSKSFAHPVSLRSSQHLLNDEISSLSRNFSISRIHQNADRDKNSSWKMADSTQNMFGTTRGYLQSWNCSLTLLEVNSFQDNLQMFSFFNSRTILQRF